MKRSMLCCLVLASAFVMAHVDAHAQATLPAPEKAKKDAPVKDNANKDAPKKDAAKKDAAKKDAKPAAKPANAPAKGTPGKTPVSKNVTVYTNTPPPPLKGKDGKPIPVTPDAYDVSSALPAKK